MAKGEARVSADHADADFADDDGMLEELEGGPQAPYPSREDARRSRAEADAAPLPEAETPPPPGSVRGDTLDLPAADPYAPVPAEEPTPRDPSRMAGDEPHGTWVEGTGERESRADPAWMDDPVDQGAEDDPFASLLGQMAEDRDSHGDGEDEPIPARDPDEAEDLDRGGLGAVFGFEDQGEGEATEAPQGAAHVGQDASSDGMAWLVGGDLTGRIERQDAPDGEAPLQEREPPQEEEGEEHPLLLDRDVEGDGPVHPSEETVGKSEFGEDDGDGEEPALFAHMVGTLPGAIPSHEPEPEPEPEPRAEPQVEPLAEPPAAMEPDHRVWVEEAARGMGDSSGSPRGGEGDGEAVDGVVVNAGAAALDQLRGALDGSAGGAEDRGSKPKPLAAPDPALLGGAGGGRDGAKEDTASTRASGNGQGRLSEAVARMEPEAPGFWHRFSIGARLAGMILLGLVALGAWGVVWFQAQADREGASDRLARATVLEALIPPTVASLRGAAAAVEGPDPSQAEALLVNARHQLIALAEAGGEAGLPRVERGALTQADGAEGLAPRVDGFLTATNRMTAEGGALTELRDAERALEEALADMPFGGSLAAQGTRLVALGRAFLLDRDRAVLSTHAGVLDLFLATAEAAVLDGARRGALSDLARAQDRALTKAAEAMEGLDTQAAALAGELNGLADATAELRDLVGPARLALADLDRAARVEAMRWILMAGGAIALVYLLLCWAMARTVTRPANRLVDALSGLSIDASPALLPGLKRRDQYGSIARSVQDHRLTAEEQAEYLRQQSQAAKAYLSAVLDGAPEAMITIDERGTVVGFNPAAEDLFGHPSPQMVGRSVTKLMPGGRDADQETGLPWFRPQDEEERHNPVRRVLAQRADGRIFPAELTVLEARREIGGVLFVMFMRDQSDLDARVREVERAKGLADEARSTHGEFLNVLANELAFPVKGLNLALGGETPDLERSEASLMLLNAITNDVRGFANLEGGLVDLNFAPVDIRGVCENARATIADMAADYGLELSLSVEPDVPATLLGDEALVETVVANLLECAVQFNATDPSLHASQPGVVALTVRLSRTEGGTLRPRFEVGCDRGAVARGSLDAKARHRPPLSPAARLRLEVGGPRGRTGMVLSITKRLVQLMHGEVGMESWPGRGTVLWFELEG